MQQRFSFLAQQFQAFGQPVVILDLEATGGNLQTDRITEIAYLRFDGDDVKAVQHLLNPETEISDFIANLTGINNEMVANAPTFAALLPEILPDLRGCILLAHNSHFDYTLLVNECQRAGVDFATWTLCTVKLSKKLYPHEYKHNLDSIAARFDLQTVGERHRAMTDVLLLADFLRLSADELQAAWLKMALNLIVPTRLPTGLPENLRADLHRLGDGWGVAHWLDKAGNTLAVRAYERGFAGAMGDVVTRRFAAAHGVRWQSAMGALDALNLCVENELSGKKVWRNTTQPRYTLVFVEQNGCLKAQVQPLPQGVFDAPPHGVFLHPKAAQKALQSWAKNENLCQTMLGISPHKLPENAPCPALQTNDCNTACATGDVAQHNEMVRAAWARLPVGDWSWRSAIAITETANATLQQKTFVCERGALRLDNGRWYWGGDLLDEIKRIAKERPYTISTVHFATHLQAALHPKSTS